MKKVGHLSEFPRGSFVSQFSGKTFDEAKEKAEKAKIEFISYFEQAHYGKSKFRTILVSHKNDEYNRS